MIKGGSHLCSPDYCCATDPRHGGGDDRHVHAGTSASAAFFRMVDRDAFDGRARASVATEIRMMAVTTPRTMASGRMAHALEGVAHSSHARDERDREPRVRHERRAASSRSLPPVPTCRRLEDDSNELAGPSLTARAERERGRRLSPRRAPNGRSADFVGGEGSNSEWLRIDGELLDGVGRVQRHVHGASDHRGGVRPACSGSTAASSAMGSDAFDADCRQAGASSLRSSALSARTSMPDDPLREFRANVGASRRATSRSPSDPSILTTIPTAYPELLDAGLLGRSKRPMGRELGRLELVDVRPRSVRHVRAAPARQRVRAPVVRSPITQTAVATWAG